MKVTVRNRLQDGEPQLELEAESKEEKRQLASVLERVHHVQLKAIRCGKAGTGNPCGSMGDSEGTDNLCFSVQMGQLDVGDLLRQIRNERGEFALAVWHIDDVFAQAKEMGRRLTVEEAEWVIEHVDSKHDATIGINWDVLSYWIDEVVREREEKRKRARRKPAFDRI